MAEGDLASGVLARRLLATRTARAAAAVLALLASAAILAPLIANDRPYWMRAIDTSGYESARTTLVPVTQAWADLRALGAAAWKEQHGASPSYEQALAMERGAIDVRARKLAEYLDAEDAGWAKELDSALSHFLDEFEDPVSLAWMTAEALDPAAPRQPRWLPRTPVGPVDPWKPVQLQSRVSLPLFAALRSLDAALVAGWLGAIASILLLHKLRARIAVTLLTALVVGLAWRPLVGSDTGPASIKDSMDRGDIVVERAWFPPIPMGFAETNLAEAFRPPTWLASSRMLPEGGYEHGRGEENAALAPMPMPVRVHTAEPALNSWRRHLLGTDSLGRDLCARLLWGARPSLLVGLASALLLTVLGVALGLLAGWCGGLVDVAVSRTIELVLCFPAFVLVLCAMFFVDPRVVPPLLAVAVIIGVVGWTGVARLVRAECLRLRELDFVAAARALGLAETRIVWKHVLPNALPPAIVAFSFAIGSAILTESALSFLGFGVQVPVPSWGSLVSDSGSSADHAWIWLFPGLCIFATVAGSNLLGEALRDALDPRHER